MTDSMISEFEISKDVGDLVRSLDQSAAQLFQEWLVKLRDAGLNDEQAASAVAKILRDQLVIMSMFSAALAGREPSRDRAIANFINAWDQWAKVHDFARASPDEQKEMIKAAHKELWEPDTGERGPGEELKKS